MSEKIYAPLSRAHKAASKHAETKRRRELDAFRPIRYPYVEAMVEGMYFTLRRFEEKYPDVQMNEVYLALASLMEKMRAEGRIG